MYKLELIYTIKPTLKLTQIGIRKLLKAFYLK